MADTIAEKILANIVTTLQGVTVNNGYVNTIKLVSRDPITALDLQLFPTVFVIDGSEDVDAMAKSSAHRKMFLTLEAWVRKERGLSTASHTLKGDIQKAMMVDPRRGGNAVNTIEHSSSAELHMDEIPEMAFQISYQVDYRTKIEDPTAAPA